MFNRAEITFYEEPSGEIDLSPLMNHLIEQGKVVFDVTAKRYSTVLKMAPLERDEVMAMDIEAIKQLRILSEDNGTGEISYSDMRYKELTIMFQPKSIVLVKMMLDYRDNVHVAVVLVSDRTVLQETEAAVVSFAPHW